MGSVTFFCADEILALKSLTVTGVIRTHLHSAAVRAMYKRVALTTGTGWSGEAAHLATAESNSRMSRGSSWESTPVEQISLAVGSTGRASDAAPHSSLGGSVLVAAGPLHCGSDVNFQSFMVVKKNEDIALPIVILQF
jgi:hypothetical protein